MKQQAFEQQHARFWSAFDAELTRLETGKPGADAADFPARYRSLCHQLALARARHYSPTLVKQLNSLALRGHQQLYRSGRPLWSVLGRFLAAGFPARVRQHARLFFLAFILFYGSLAAIGVGSYYQPELVYSMMSSEQVDEMEAMYDPGKRVIGRERESDSDVLMFGFYLMHNTGLGFQTFAGGLLAGLGTVFYLLYNGLAIGAVAGHLTRLGYTDTFWPFVCGHSAFELTAIVLAGQAGLKLGWAVLAPGRLRRAEALKAAARPCVELITGSALFFFIAAFIEAFWSSRTSIPIPVKYGVAAILWGFVAWYLARCGRGLELEPAGEDRHGA